MIRINLLPHREAARKAKRQQFAAVTGAVVGSAALLVMMAYSVIGGYVDRQESDNQFMREQVALLDRDIDQIKRLKDQTRALLARKQIIEDLQKDRGDTVRLLSEMVTQVPEGVYLKSLKQNGQKINLVGYAQSNARVSALMRNLEASPWLDSPELLEVKAVVINGRRINEFIMNVNLSRATTGTAAQKGLP